MQKHRNVRRCCFVAGVLAFIATEAFAPPIPLPTLAVTRTNNSLIIKLTATPFSRHVLEEATNLQSSPVEWTTTSTPVIVSSQGNAVWGVEITTNVFRYYRTRQVQ